MQVACGAKGTPRIYVQARNSLSLAELMGYQNLVEGHGDHGRGDAIWRGISAVYLAEQRPRDYRAMRDRLTWFYDLSRDANGGMGIATHSTDTDVRSGVAVALAYTAPLKTLLITGAPRSRYAKEFTLPTYLWGNPADMAFFGLDHNPTYYKYGKDEPTHLAVNLLGSAYTKGPPPKTIPRQRKILEGLLVTEFRGPLARKLIEWKAVNNGQDDKRLSDIIAELSKLAKSQTTDADTDAPKPDPAPGGWQEFTRTYAAGDLRKYVGKSIKIVCGVGRDSKSFQTAFDDVSLIYYQHKPTRVSDR